MKKWYGFREIKIFGCTVGRFNRKDKPSPKEFELLAIAQK